MYCFAVGAVASLGKEQFIGLYMSAGVISSMCSYFHRTLTKKPGFSLGAVSWVNTKISKTSLKSGSTSLAWHILQIQILVCKNK
jgi:hypothetical protein